MAKCIRLLAADKGDHVSRPRAQVRARDKLDWAVLPPSLAQQALALDADNRGYKAVDNVDPC